MAHLLTCILLVTVAAAAASVQAISDEQFYELDLARKAARLSANDDDDARPPPRYIRYGGRELPVAPGAREVTEPEAERAEVLGDDDEEPTSPVVVRSGEPTTVLSVPVVAPQMALPPPVAALGKSGGMIGVATYQSEPIKVTSYQAWAPVGSQVVEQPTTGAPGYGFLDMPPLKLYDLQKATKECLNKLIASLVTRELPSEGLKFRDQCCRLIGCAENWPWKGFIQTAYPGQGEPIKTAYQGQPPFPWGKLGRLIDNLTATSTSKPSVAPTTTTTPTTATPTTTTTMKPTTTTSTTVAPTKAKATKRASKRSTRRPS